MQDFRTRALAGVLPFLLAAPGLAYAQPVQPPTPAEAQAALNPAPDQAQFTPAQLDQMLAPIALYPDQLLMQLLMASTFPQQVLDADRWLQDPSNAALHGEQLAGALQPLPWDPSVKSLVAFPQIIVMMTDHLDWTQALGVAFADEQIETMARIQFLRDRAAAAGHLKSTPQLVVQRRGEEIVIEPAKPGVVFVPVYNPAVVFGEWPHHGHPPVFIPPPPHLYSGPVPTGIGYSVALTVVQPLWGWEHPDWRQHVVVVDPRRYTTITRETTTTERRDVRIEGDRWQRGAPVAFVPEQAWPHHPRTEEWSRPAGTAAPTAVAMPRQEPGQRPRGGEAGAANPSGAPSNQPQPSQSAGVRAPNPASSESPTSEPSTGRPTASTHSRAPSNAPGEHPSQPAAAHPPSPAPGNTPTEHRNQPAAAHPPSLAPGNAPAEHPNQPAAAHPPSLAPGNAPAEHPNQPAAAHPPSPAPGNAPAEHPNQPAAAHPPSPAPESAPAEHPNRPASAHPPSPAPGNVPAEHSNQPTAAHPQGPGAPSAHPGESTAHPGGGPSGKPAHRPGEPEEEQR